MQLSIIIPAYNEEGNIKKIYESIIKALKKVNYEIIFINDGSIDNTDIELVKLYDTDKKHVKTISFSRNFGKDAAIYAGLEYANGKYTSIIDADMQQDPKYLLEMYNFLERNADYDQVAMTIKKRKNIALFKRIGGNFFYKVINLLSNTEFKQNASDFRMFRENVKEAIISLKETNRFSKGIISWIGFNTKYMEYDVKSRYAGKTKFNFKKSINYAVEGITDYSDKPLKLATCTGLIMFIPSFICLLYIIIKSIIIKEVLNKFLMIIFLIISIGGFQLICIGIIGKYLYKSFIETKKRPIYIIKRKDGFTK